MTDKVWLSDRLAIPSSAAGILWDMDGVLIDSIRLDYDVCTHLIRRFVDPGASISRELIREGFPLSAADFWRFLLERVGAQASDEQFGSLVAAWERERASASHSLNPGIIEILAAARERGLPMAVVSNNERDSIRTILERAGILDTFDAIVGNDHDGIRKKPAPDAYLKAAELLRLSAETCVVIEDSGIGIEAGRAAGAHSISVATGGETFEQLSKSRPDACYHSFSPNKVTLAVGDVLNKNIVTPNEFVSHMIEHIAWRLGTSIDLAWSNDDWRLLGIELARPIAKLARRRGSAAVIGMIDDGSAEVCVRMDGPAGLDLTDVDQLSLGQLLAVRCEQLESGEPLKELLEGLVRGLNAALTVRVCSFEDPHHTWEGIFRATGMALGQAIGISEDRPPSRDVDVPERPVATNGESTKQGAGFLRVVSMSPHSCHLIRETAESVVQLNVEVSDAAAVSAKLAVSPSIDVSDFPKLLDRFAASAGLRMTLEYSATKLSSSHVVLEDTALVLGAALFKIMEARMTAYGVNGAGSSLQTVTDFDNAAVAAAVSVEGRKFLKFVPFDISPNKFKSKFVIGRDAFSSVRCEDIDDFLDALAGGMRASMLLHFRKTDGLESAALWQQAITSVGEAVRQAIDINPIRKGLPPGVKATLV